MFLNCPRVSGKESIGWLTPKLNSQQLLLSLLSQSYLLLVTNIISALAVQRTLHPIDLLLLYRASIARTTKITSLFCCCFTYYYLAIALLYLLALRSLPMNGWVCHNTYNIITSVALSPRRSLLFRFPD
jgi:hypothetical protein